MRARRPRASTSATTRSAGRLTSLSAGTRESLVGVTLGDNHAYREGRVRTRAPGGARALVHRRGPRARGDLGRRRRALRAARVLSRGCARSTSTSAGSARWRGRCRRARWSARSSGACPGARRRCGWRASGSLGLLGGPEAGTTPGGRSWIAAEAYDGAGRQLSEVHLAGVDGVRVHGVVHGVGGAAAGLGGGALGPVAGLRAGGAAAGARPGAERVR